MLMALDRYLGPANELVLIGDLSRDDTKDSLSEIHRRYLPRSVLAARNAKPATTAATRATKLDAIFAGKSSPDGQPVLYVCQNFACQAPASGLDAIKTQLDQISPAHVSN
jgi:uncharacterized protein YyaL (SSP411 family)